MNKTKHYLLPLLLSGLSLLTACSDDDGGAGGNTVRVQWGVVENDGLAPLAEGTALGIFLHNTTAADTLLHNDSLVANRNGEPQGFPSLSADSTYTIHAVHPYLPSLDDAASLQAFAVASDQSTAAAFDHSDLFTGSTTVQGSAAQVRLSHLLTKVIVHVTDLTGRCDFLHLDTLTSRATLSNMATTLTFSIEDGLQSVADSRSTVTMWLGNRTVYRLTAMAIVPPQQLAEAQSTFSLSLNGRETESCDIPAVAYEGGKTYVYKLKLTHDGLVPDGTYVMGWTDGNNGQLTGE